MRKRKREGQVGRERRRDEGRKDKTGDERKGGGIEGKRKGGEGKQEKYKSQTWPERNKVKEERFKQIHFKNVIILISIS